MSNSENITWNKTEMIKLLPWLLLFFTLPVFPFLVPASVVLIILSLLFRYKELRWAGGKWSLLFVPIAIYLLYILGLFRTETAGMAAIVAERKLSFLIFPVLFLAIPLFSKSQRSLLLYVFTAGAVLHSLISLGLSVSCFMQNGSRDCFFSSSFSFLLHPSYSALYDVIIIAWLSIKMISDIDRATVREKIYFLTLIVWLVFIIMLLASKAGLISLIVVAILSLIYFIIKRKKIKQAIIAAIIILVAGAGSLLVTTVPLERFKNIFSSSGLSEKELFEQYRTSTESTPVRRMIWICAKEIIRHNPLGVGSGDANTELMKKYEEKGMTGAYSRELNAHNQYYQVTLALGYPGLILLCIMILLGTYSAIRKKNVLFLFFLIVVAINLAVESMFETQAGVVFILLFFCFLYTYDETEINSTGPEGGR